MSSPNVGGQAGAYVNEADRKTPEHDAICQFLVEEPRMFLGAFGRDHDYERIDAHLGLFSTGWRCSSCNEQFDSSEEGRPVSSSKSRCSRSVVAWTEQPLVNEGYGGKRWVNGYVDVVVKIDNSYRIGIEVKSRPCSVSEVIRQIEFYREQAYLGFYEPNSYERVGIRWWVYVSRYPLQAGEEDLLKKHEIAFVQLGPAFEKWKAQRSVVQSSRVL